MFLTFLMKFSTVNRSIDPIFKKENENLKKISKNMN